MFYKFNSMMGRITASTQLEAYIPQKQDGLMVWQKFGRDRALYGATIGLTVLGFTVAFAQLYTMAFPPKNE
nr:hypothetical protein BaRGS_010391 [Batillaria attramentaria]